MKRLFIISILVSVANFYATAAYLVDIPQTLIQPNGQVIHCFASGDEFYNWLHDENGFTIIQGSDGYYYYATQTKGKIVASRYKVGTVDPATKGLKPHLKISREEYLEKRKSMFPLERKSLETKNNTGVLNGITIYIRFADDTNFSQQTIAQLHQNFDGANNSMRNYFQRTSYGQLDVRTTHIPANNTGVVTTFVSSRNRNYFQPRSATNPAGYDPNSNNDRAHREFQLLRDAIDWVRNNNLIPNDINIDRDGDGYADLVNFIVKGRSEGWNSILWPHKWALQRVGTTNYETVISGNIRVREYTFLPEDQASVRVLCHEVFHVLGAPDLYHYDDAFRHLNPAGSWDVMGSGSGHMLGHMKVKYGGWINPASIQEITAEGTYTLLSQGKNQTSNLFKIPGATSTSEYFLIEYRQRTDDVFEANLPGSGLIVTRINPNMRGNANYNGKDILDEVYVLRPDGSVTADGTISNANLSNRVGRTALSKHHAIKPFFSNGTFADFTIFNVIDSGDFIRFRFSPTTAPDPINIAGRWNEDSIFLSWRPSASEKNVVLIYDTVPITGFLETGTTYQIGEKLSFGPTVLHMGSDSSFTHRPIIPGKTYYYRLFTNASSKYSVGIDIRFLTVWDTVSKIDTIHNFLPSDNEFGAYWLAINNVRNGYITGHNALRFSKFVELYKNETVRRVNGLIFNIGVLQQYNADASLLLQVWDVNNAGTPGQELAVQEIPYRDLRLGWNTVYFKNPPIVKSNFFIGLTIHYRTPTNTDTIAFRTTLINNSRETTTFVYTNEGVFASISSRVTGAHVGMAYRSILQSGGLYLTTLPQWISPPTEGARNQIINIYTTYQDYEVVSNEDWIHVSVNKALDQIVVDVDPTTVDRIGEILIIADTDTVRAFVRQGVSVSVQEDVELAVSLFPNPSSDGIFYLQSDGEEMQLDVFDILGRNIWSRRTFSTGEKIDLSRHQKGMYFLRIIKNGQQKTFKLIIS